jgi:hypothetical protein
MSNPTKEQNHCPMSLPRCLNSWARGRLCRAESARLIQGQAWCGTRYDCGQCTSTNVLPRREIVARYCAAGTAV